MRNVSSEFELLACVVGWMVDGGFLKSIYKTEKLMTNI